MTVIIPADLKLQCNISLIPWYLTRYHILFMVPPNIDFQYEPCDRIFSLLRKMDVQMNEWLKKRHIKSFYCSVANPSLRQGAQTLLQVPLN